MKTAAFALIASAAALSNSTHTGTAPWTNPTLIVPTPPGNIDHHHNATSWVRPIATGTGVWPCPDPAPYPTGGKPHHPHPTGTGVWPHPTGTWPHPLPHPVGPDGKPLPHPVGPDGKPLPHPVGPDGKPHPHPHPVGPDGKPLPYPPSHIPTGPDGKPLHPGGSESSTLSTSVSKTATWTWSQAPKTTTWSDPVHGWTSTVIPGGKHTATVTYGSSGTPDAESTSSSSYQEAAGSRYEASLGAMAVAGIAAVFLI